MNTCRQRVSKAMWFIKSFKTELPSNAILVSNFHRIAIHKKKTAWNPSYESKTERQRQSEGVHLIWKIIFNLNTRDYVEDDSRHQKQLKETAEKVFLLCSSYLFWHIQCSAGCTATVFIHDQTSTEYSMDEVLVEKQLRLPQQVKKSKKISCVWRVEKEDLAHGCRFL